MNISVTDNRTITVVINGTEHKLSIKDAEALRDALVKALPTPVPRPEYYEIADLLKKAKREHINTLPWGQPLPFHTPTVQSNVPQVWCGITDDHGHRVFL